jgi:N utilization substance protein A
MAKREETISMIDTLAEFKELKNIDKETMINVLEESFRNVIAKMFGTDENYDVIINPEKGDFEIWRNRIAVDDDKVEDPNLQIPISEAHAIDPDSEVGEEVTDEVHFADFGRRAILNLRQTLSSKILELQKDNLFAKYNDMIGSVVSADVYQVWKKEILLLDDEGNELLLPKSEQIPSDFYGKGQAVRAVVQRVESENNNTKIYLSRTDKVFLQRLFELEVPEINDGLITIKAIARIPGERAKIAVESYDDRIDPVGACVGMKGSRIRGIVRELRNENIDVINYSANTSLFIQRSLSPAKISSIRLYEDERKAEVSLRPEEVSLAIGKGGLNIKLACMLTDYTIDVFRDIDATDEEDIYLDEFSDEIDSWVIEALKNIGCNTAKAVLAMKREELVERADLEEQTVDDVFAILRTEFEDEAQEEKTSDNVVEPEGETTPESETMPEDEITPEIETTPEDEIKPEDNKQEDDKQEDGTPEDKTPEDEIQEDKKQENEAPEDEISE